MVSSFTKIFTGPTLIKSIHKQSFFIIQPFPIPAHPGQSLDGPLRGWKKNALVFAAVETIEGSGIVVGQQTDAKHRFFVLSRQTDNVVDIIVFHGVDHPGHLLHCLRGVIWIGSSVVLNKRSAMMRLRGCRGG